MVDLQHERVAVGALVVGPQVTLHEAHAIERDALAAHPAIGALLGILEPAAAMVDDADFSARIGRRADVPRLAEIDDPYPVAEPVGGLSRHGRGCPREGSFRFARRAPPGR